MNYYSFISLDWLIFHLEICSSKSQCTHRRDSLSSWLCKCWTFWWKSQFMTHKSISNDNWTELRMMDSRTETIWPNVAQNQDRRRNCAGGTAASWRVLFIYPENNWYSESEMYTSSLLSVPPLLLLLLPFTKSSVPFWWETNFRSTSQSELTR